MAKTNGQKRELRRARWAELRAIGAARFPGAVGRIPNFTGAENAADRLAAERVWQRAATLKCNPDLAQRPVRWRALRAGKRVYLAVPRLAAAKPFLLLDPARLDSGALWLASSIQGATELGRPVSVAEVAAIDLVIVGAVAVSADGARLGKGGGWADLEHALLLETGRIGPRTPVVTTVHATGVLDAGEIPMEPHDVPLDGFATADGFTRCRRARRRPEGVLWDRLDAERVAEIPALARFARRTQGGRTRGRGGASRGPSAPRRG